MDPTHKSLSIVCWNAQSIRNKLTETEHFLNSNNIDVILFSETWLKNYHNTSIQNYKLYRKDRFGSQQTVGGGVAIAIKNGIPHSLLPNINTKIIESIGIEIYSNNITIRLVSVYFPGTRLTISKLKDFKNDLKILTSSKNNFIIGGDLNAKHRFWNCIKANKAGQILFNEMNIRNFLIHFSPTPTYYPSQARRVIPSTLDIILSNGSVSPYNIRTLQALSSDHLPVAFDIDFVHNKSLTLLNRRCYAKANWIQFRAIIDNSLNLSISSKINSNSAIESAIINFIDLIKSAQNMSIPLMKMPQVKTDLHNGIQVLISERNLKRRQWQRNRDFALKTEVNYLNRLIKKRILLMANHKWNVTISKFKNNSRQLWRATKLIKNKYNFTPPLKDSSKSILLTDQEKANEIASSFCKSHYITYNDKSDNPTETAVNSSFQNINFFCDQVKESDMPKPKEISNIIHFLKNRKSPGHDGINNILLKKLPKKAIVHMGYIFRACVRNAYFPSCFKCAKVIAIPKPGKDLSSANNYRPISLLSTIGKILEKILKKRLNNYIQSKDILPAVQFGFREGHSTNHQLLRVTNHIKSNLKNGRSTGMLIFDVEKAFDGIWHKALLHKMFLLKFPLYLIKITKSFITNRRFYVSLGNANSNEFNIVAGVPQGSILSPILYNIFISDLKVPTHNCEMALFADDTAIYCSAKNPSKIIRSLNDACKHLTDYCIKWKIKLNATKTQATFFSKRRCVRLLPTEEVSVLNTKIPWKNELKYLGVTLDKSLTFRPHIDATVEKALKYIGILYSLINSKSKLNIYNKLTLYKTIFRSILLYACPIWGNCAQVHLLKIQRVQNKVLKIIHNLPSDYPTQHLHRLSDILLINQQIYKINNNFINKFLTSDNYLIRQLEVL